MMGSILDVFRSPLSRSIREQQQRSRTLRQRLGDGGDASSRVAGSTFLRWADQGVEYAETCRLKGKQDKSLRDSAERDADRGVRHAREFLDAAETYCSR